MAKDILWTPKADASFDEIIEYLRKEWSEREVSNFAKETLRTLEVIKKFPESFVLDRRFGFRKARINKLVTLIYLEKEDPIELLLFWNNRRNPAKRF